MSVISSWQFRTSVENFQVAMICEETMALFAGRLTNDAEFHHVLQSLRHSGRREGELLGCRRDRDDRLPLKVLVICTKINNYKDLGAKKSYKRGSTGSLSRARTPKSHSRMRRSGSWRTNRSKASWIVGKRAENHGGEQSIVLSGVFNRIAFR